MNRKAILLLVLLALLPLTASAASFEVACGAITAYADNVLTVTAPASGTVTVTISDAYNEYRTLRLDVAAGENTFHWDGLREDGQRIGVSNGTYTLGAVFSPSEGERLRLEQQVEVTKPKQAMLFALPSSDRLYLGGGEDWFVETCLVRAGNIVMEVYPEDQSSTPVLRRSYRISESIPQKYRWSGVSGTGGKVSPGVYRVRYYAEENPDYDHWVTVEAVEGTAPEVPVRETGALMPAEGMSDGEIWLLMMKPSVVVDIKNVNHQNVYAEKSTKSRVLGTLHGQSQAVEVLKVLGDWCKILAWRHEDGAPVVGYVQTKNLKTVYPNAHYGLLIDKVSQQMTVYHDGQVVTVLPVSTGLPAKGKLIRETAAGSFLTIEHMGPFSDGGYKYAFPIRYDGGNLLHQIGYPSSAKHPDFSAQLKELGTKASHACVRIADHPLDQSGIDAYWLWSHLPWHTRVLILDDPEAREAAYAAITGAAPERLAEDTATWGDLKPVQDDGTWAGDEIRLTLGGDTVLGIRETWWSRDDALPAFLERNGMAYPFQSLQALFAKDDMTLVNLECVLKKNNRDEALYKEFRFRGLPSWSEALTLGSIEQVNVANNHFIDYKAAGQKETLAALREAGISYSGYTNTFIWECRGHLIGFAGIRETVYLKDKQLIEKEIRSLRDQGCEVVIYSCHWGSEYAEHHNELQVEMAKVAADAGADLIVGTHPHVVQGLGVYGHTPVIYSLGNLMFGGTLTLPTYDGLVMSVSLRFDEAGYIGCALTPVPVMTSGQAAEGINDYQPCPAQGADRERILSLVQEDTSFPLSGSMWFPAR